MESSPKLVPIPKLAPIRRLKKIPLTSQSSSLLKPPTNKFITKPGPSSSQFPQKQVLKPLIQQNQKSATNIPLNAKDECNLSWSEFSTNFCDGFGQLLTSQQMVDVTLAAEGKYIQAHKLVLSVCSDYFKELFHINPCQHPIVILKDVEYESLNSIVQFMYLGQVQITTDKLPGLLATAQQLKVKGLIRGKTTPEAPGNKTPTEPAPPTSVPTQSIPNASKKVKRQRIQENIPTQVDEPKKTISYSIPMDVKVKVMRKRQAQDIGKNKTESPNNSTGLRCSYRPSNIINLSNSPKTTTDKVKIIPLYPKFTTVTRKRKTCASPPSNTDIMEIEDDEVTILEDEIEIEDVVIKKEPIDIDENMYRVVKG